MLTPLQLAAMCRMLACPVGIDVHQCSTEHLCLHVGSAFTPTLMSCVCLQ
jgi:hypothetical protein